MVTVTVERFGESLTAQEPPAGLSPAPEAKSQRPKDIKRMSVFRNDRVPLGPWVEFRRKRPVMIAMDLTRFVSFMSVLVTFVFGRLSFIQLLAVSVIFAAANLTFKAASGAYLKTIVRGEDMLEADARFEATTWTATALGPPLGGGAFGLFGPMATVMAEAVSYLVSAAAVCAIGEGEPLPVRFETPQWPAREMFEGWRYVMITPSLRLLFFNPVLVNSLVMATSPLVAVLMLGHLGFSPWQYGLALGAPCVGGVIGSRLAPRLVKRFGHRNRGRPARCLAHRARLHAWGYSRHHICYRRPAWTGHLYGRVPPGIRSLSSRSDCFGPCCPCPIGTVGYQ